MKDAPTPPEDARPPSISRVFTIGHSTREFDEVLEMLHENGVTHLVDVRSLPGSKRFPQWNRETIAENIPPDISYRWMPKLGGRRYTPKGTPSPNGGWRVRAFRDYADYMATGQFEEGLTDLMALAEDGPVAIMCSEAVPWRCHRRLITDALLARGVEVFDIMGKGASAEASMTPFAKVEGDSITYPPPGEEQTAAV